MVIISQGRSSAQNILEGFSSFAGGMAQGMGSAEDIRLARQRMQLIREAQEAEQKIQQEETGYRRSERERAARQRAADEELRRLLVGEQRRSSTPTAQQSPELTAQGVANPAAAGVLAQGLSRVMGGQPSDPEKQLAEEEHRKWDSFERLAPELSPDGAKLLFAKLAQDSQERTMQQQYGALARRVGQLTRPAKTPQGGEMPGLNPDDPEQAELLSKLTGMIDERADPEDISDALAKLEGEMKRDRLHAIKRESALTNMTQALEQGKLPGFASQEEIDHAHEIFLDLQQDETRDPDDAWKEFRSALFGGKDRWTEAYEKAAQLTLKNPDSPRLPTESEVFEVGSVLYPFDPRFRTDIQNFPQSPLHPKESPQNGSARVLGLTSGGGAAPAQAVAASEPAGQAPAISPEKLAHRVSDLLMHERRGRASPTPEPAAQAKSGGAKPQAIPRSMSLVGLGAKPADRAEQLKITPEVIQSMSKAVEKAKTPEDADRALAALAEKAGIKPEKLPDWLLKTLAGRFRLMKHPNADVIRGLEGDPEQVAKFSEQAKNSLELEAPKFGQKTAFDEGPIKYETGMEDEQPKPEQAVVGAKVAKPLKRWKRMPPEEQKAAEKKLLEAVEKATRHDFHGALAPTLREFGIDLGSIPKDVAQRFRNALKKKRAKG